MGASPPRPLQPSLAREARNTAPRGAQGSAPKTRRASLHRGPSQARAREAKAGPAGAGVPNEPPRRAARAATCVSSRARGPGLRPAAVCARSPDPDRWAPHRVRVHRRRLRGQELRRHGRREQAGHRAGGQSLELGQRGRSGARGDRRLRGRGLEGRGRDGRGLEGRVGLCAGALLASRCTWKATGRCGPHRDPEAWPPPER